MSDQDGFEQENGSRSRRAERRARIDERRDGRYEGGFGWMAGLVFIAIGVCYFLYQYGYLPALANWWALFLLLPAVGTLAAAVGAYRRRKHLWAPEVVGLFIAAIFFFSLTAAFLFSVDFSWLWPLFLIAAGLVLMGGA
ncbi:MAG: LiaF transmembrane domain-containing protein, partial [Candidatus Promineifilaceae bacterium]